MMDCTRVAVWVERMPVIFGMMALACAIYSSIAFPFEQYNKRDWFKGC
jgi:hypothetical protein